jgi:hypothetical protein
MTDPKMALTKFTEVYAARSAFASEALRLGRDNLRESVAADTALIRPRFRDTAFSLAASGSVHEQDEVALAQLQSQYSISSVEEVVAISRVSKGGTKLLARAGLRPQTVRSLATAFRRTPVGKQELADWARYDRLEYTTGFEINLNKPPVEPAGFGAPAPGAMGMAAQPPTPAPTAAVSLIDANMSAIRDQGRRGTCTAFAGVACLEYYERRFGGHSSDLSEQFAYWNMVKKDKAHALVPMFQRLKADGTCTERTWPYYQTEIAGNDSQDPPPPGAAAEAKTYRPKEVLQLSPRNVDAIRTAISELHPVAIGIPVYASWYESGVVRKYGNITVPLPGEVPDPIGHAITLVGYEDNADYAGGGYFIVRNSWGKNWATSGVFGSGYGTIPYRYISDFNWDAWHVAS